MAKFTYRMQNILDIKIKLENQAKIAYATASRQLAEEQEKLREILMRRAGYERKSKELVNGTLDIQRPAMTMRTKSRWPSLMAFPMAVRSAQVPTG